MLRYRLDDLGWFHFEKLVQSLLKAELGPAVQSWGGSGDLGRDAYTPLPLRFPDRSTPATGPFLFQAKFVQGANAAGAHWRPLLLKAVASEKVRIKQHKNAGIWREPAQYVLLTNCPLTATAREEVTTYFRTELPTTGVTTLGGSDLCDLLDRNPELRRTFPEILSLRDLDLLLSEAVSKPVLERSRAAIEEARDLVPVFVPTQAYHKAWQSLQTHSFVVLDGPPEMGKTAIARTIALAHVMLKWQVIECRNPSDFFAAFTDQREQLFVADDAFGRTEYDPVLGRLWEQDLPRVFQFLGSRHRLIWTARKHILTRARRDMDLTGKSARFPEPGEVIVTADDLSIEEKARVLYRHSRAADLTVKQRQIVRDNAADVVKDPHFTPERIRRFVCDLLPEVAGKSERKRLNSEAIAQEIHEAIRNPTDRMRKSFRKLSPTHTWVLIAFLECDRPVQADILRSRFAAFQPTVSDPSFRESLDDLLGAFLKLGYGLFHWQGKRVDWIHPSYRDLVIEEIASTPRHGLRFLNRVSTSGVKLALSLAGGSSGERQMPLMTTETSWRSLARRSRELASSEDDDTVAELLDVLENALKAEGIPASSKTNVEAILRSVCGVAVDRWNEREEPLAIDALKSFHRACAALIAPPPFTRIESSCEASSEQLREELRTSNMADPSRITRWSEFVDLIERHYPEFAETTAFRACRAQIESELFRLADELVGYGTNLEDPESNESEGRRLEEFAEALSRLDRDMSHHQVIANLYGIGEDYKENGPTEEEGDYDAGDASGPAADFDVKALFEDL